jgi:hypothetical protein
MNKRPDLERLIGEHGGPWDEWRRIAKEGARYALSLEAELAQLREQLEWVEGERDKWRNARSSDDAEALASAAASEWMRRAYDAEKERDECMRDWHEVAHELVSLRAAAEGLAEQMGQIGDAGIPPAQSKYVAHLLSENKRLQKLERAATRYIAGDEDAYYEIRQSLAATSKGETDE